MSQDLNLGAAWRKYLAVFEEAETNITGSSRFGNNPDYRRRMYRAFMQVQAMSYNFAVVPRADRPRSFIHTTYQTDFYTLGMACPDFYYAGLFLDGSRRYRISGRVGATRWMAAQVQSHLMGDIRVRNVGDFDFADFELGADGSFDIIASGGEERGNHIQLAAESSFNFIWVRRILGDWGDDPGELHVELLDSGSSKRQEDDGTFLERLERAANLARFLLGNWAIGLHDWYLNLAQGYNRIAFLEGARVADREVGSKAAYYAGFVFKLQADEALLVEGDVPEGVYWSFQLGDVWSNSLDFLYHQSDLNMVRMKVDSDGRYRVVLAPVDPGLPNWLDTVGNLEGVGMMRVFRSPRRPTLPNLRVVKNAELARLLPTQTQRVTPAERDRALAHREAAIKTMYCQ
jgi:hypothetical protein